MQQRTTRGKHVANGEHMAQQQREGGTPADATAMRVDRDVKVTMRDGVRISLCVYRPQAEGRVPALFAASPYQHEFDTVPAFPLFLWRETGPIEWYVAQGYAYVHADVRGSGRSEGEFGFMDATEQEDYVELIAWIAQQPWCNGRVGGIGQSYYAMAQWLMATRNPPGLACIAPYDGLVDQYRCSNYHGGIFCSYRSSWYANLRADNQHRPAGAAGRPPMRFDLVGAITEHTLDDDWWRERSAFERLGEIKVPVLSIGHWGKMGLHLRGNILGFEEVRAPKKLVVTGAKNVHEAHHQFDQVEFHQKELLPFYDRHLKGMDNGFMDGAPVRLFIRGADVWREEPQWPLARAQYVRYFLRKGPSGSVTSLNDGALSTEPPAADERRPPMPIRTGNGPAAWWRMARTGGRTRCGGFSPSPRRRSRPISRSPGRSCSSSSLIGPDRHPLHRQACRPGAAGGRRARKGRAARLHQRLKGLAAGLAPREGSDPRDRAASVLYPHQSAAAHARGDLPLRHRDAADRLCVQEGSPHPAGDRQRRLRR